MFPERYKPSLPVADIARQVVVAGHFGRILPESPIIADALDHVLPSSRGTDPGVALRDLQL